MDLSVGSILSILKHNQQREKNNQDATNIKLGKLTAHGFVFAHFLIILKLQNNNQKETTKICNTQIYTTNNQHPGSSEWPFSEGLSDLHLGDQKVTWKKLDYKKWWLDFQG